MAVYWPEGFYPKSVARRHSVPQNNREEKTSSKTSGGAHGGNTIPHRFDSRTNPTDAQPPVGFKRRRLGPAQCLRRLEAESAISKVPRVPWEDLEVEQYGPQIPDEDSVLKVLKAMPIPRAGIFVARAAMGFRPSEARRLNVSDLKLGQRDDLA